LKTSEGVKSPFTKVSLLRDPPNLSFLGPGTGLKFRPKLLVSLHSLFPEEIRVLTVAAIPLILCCFSSFMRADSPLPLLGWRGRVPMKFAGLFLVVAPLLFHQDRMLAGSVPFGQHEFPPFWHRSRNTKLPVLRCGARNSLRPFGCPLQESPFGKKTQKAELHPIICFFSAPKPAWVDPKALFFSTIVKLFFPQR